MKSLFASLLILSTLTVLAGCQQPERPIGPDGRPNVPAEQPVPGGPMSKGPVGQPQARPLAASVLTAPCPENLLSLLPPGIITGGIFTSGLINAHHHYPD